MKKIQITLHKDGTQKIEVLEASGTECTELTAGFEKRLGTQVGERVLKPEYHETQHEVETQQEYDR